MAEKKQKRSIWKIAWWSFWWIVGAGVMATIYYFAIASSIVTDAEKQTAANNYMNGVSPLLEQHETDMSTLQTDWDAAEASPAEYMQRLTDIRDSLSDKEKHLWQDKAITKIVLDGQQAKYGLVRYEMPWDDRPELDKYNTYTFSKNAGVKNYVYLGPGGVGTATVPLEAGAQELALLVAYIEENDIRVVEIGMTSEGDGGFLQEDIPPFTEFRYVLTDEFGFQ